MVPVFADSTAQTLPYGPQTWSTASQITADDNWSGVTGIVGYLGDYTTSSPTNVNPQTLLQDMTTVDVIANQSNPNTLISGGVAEFDGIANPTIALQGSGTADAPNIVLNLNTTGKSNITVSYNLRDIDGSADDAVQQFALQFRVGSSGSYTNVPAGYVADATTGPSQATLVTPVSAVLPSAADNKPLVQVRIMTTNASGNDEWVGIDDITASGTTISNSTNPTGAGSATPGSVAVGETTLLTVAVTPGTNPTSTAHTVSADLSSIGGSISQSFFDDGSHGDATANDNVFSFSATVASGTGGGAKTLPVTITETSPNSRTGTASISLTVLAPTNPSATGTASPNSLLANETTLLTVNVTPGTNPASTGLSVTADLSSIGGSPSQSFAGNGNVFTFQATVASGTSTGVKSLPVVISDAQGRSANTSISLNVEQPPQPVTHVVISQIYGGGGNSNAKFQNDYVELYNPTNAPVDLGGWTIQYASATGTSWQAQPLGGVMQPGEYYLVALATGGATGDPLPDSNIQGSINMSGTTGKVALANSGDPLTGSCPTDDPTVVDFVGYGSNANCREGLTNAPAPSNTTAILRKGGGLVDTDTNSSDFIVGTPNPRRTTPITEIGPYVLNVDPRSNASSAPRDANITITFTEAVSVDTAQSWFNINCASTGAHNDATVASANGGGTWIIIPNQNFQAGEQCAVTIFKDFVHDVDTDDSGAGTDTLKADYSWSFNVATGTAPPYGPEVNLTMGNPSGAVTDLNQPNNYLMVKPEFTLSYNRDRGTPNWVSWHLSDEWIGSLARVDTFRADPMVPSDWYRVLATDYFGSGFDRGHMTPNADRDKETSAPINQATFLMSNMVPQAPDNNQGPWADMENYLRSLLPANELYIVAGPAGTGGTGSSGFTTTIANGKITVPAYTWKVVLVLPKQNGNDVERVTAGARTIAVIMPNTQGIRGVDWTTYIKSVDEVEALTGYDFFSEVPDAVENAIEAGTNGVNPPGTANMSLTVQEDSPLSFTLDAASPNNNPLSYTIVSGPSHGTLTGTGAQRDYTPEANFAGTDTFTFRVNDGQRDSNVSTVTINVTPVNDLPQVSGVPASATIDEGQAYSFTASATDVETASDALTYSLEGAPDGASISSTGVFNWTPSETQGGASYSFSVRVSDGTGYTDAPVTLNVNEVNQAPTLAAIDNKTVELGNTLSFQAAGSDADLPAQTLTYSLTGTVPAGAAIDGSTGVFSWTPVASQAGTIYSFNVRVTDNGSPNLYTEQPVQVAVAYTWTGALSPIKADGTSVFKLGSTVPVKFKLTGASAGISTAVAKVYIAKLTNNVAGTETEALPTGNSSTGNLFRYDATADQYIFNLNTKGLTPGTYQLRVDTGDGVLRTITFGLN